jgi:hypothetical protein
MMDGDEMIGAMADDDARAPTCVTFGVTGGHRGCASASSSRRMMAEAKRVTSIAKHRAIRGKNWRRGNFVEIIFSQAEHRAAKPLKKMVGTTGIEPVTPTMSR